MCRPVQAGSKPGGSGCALGHAPTRGLASGLSSRIVDPALVPRAGTPPGGLVFRDAAGTGGPVSPVLLKRQVPGQEFCSLCFAACSCFTARVLQPAGNQCCRSNVSQNTGGVTQWPVVSACMQIVTFDRHVMLLRQLGTNLWEWRGPPFCMSCM